MKEFDFTQIKHYKLYNFIKAVFRPLVKLVFKAKFKGLENVPQDKGCLLYTSPSPRDTR